MPVRDRRADRAYFERAIESKDAAVGRGEQEIETPVAQRRTPDLVAVAANNAAVAADIAFSSRYSRGDDRAALRASFDRWLALAERAALEKAAGRAERLVAAQDKPGGVYALYMQRLRLLGVAHALGVDDGTFARVAAAVQQLVGDRLVSQLIAVRSPDTEVSDTLWQPRMRPLSEVFDAAADERPALVAAYLAKKWYPAMKGLTWYDGHLYLDKLSYHGYWAFEVAGTVAALGIDDGSFRADPSYPADLVVR